MRHDLIAIYNVRMRERNRRLAMAKQRQAAARECERMRLIGHVFGLVNRMQVNQTDSAALMERVITLLENRLRSELR